VDSPLHTNKLETAQ